MSPKRPTDRMTVSKRTSGLWVAEDDGSHLLGLVAGSLEQAPRLVLPFKPAVRDGMGAYITEGELGFLPTSREELVDALREMPSELTFINIAALLSRVSRVRTDASGQLELAESLFGDAEVMSRLRAWCATDGHVIFSEQALFALLAQAVIHCREDTSEEFSEDEQLESPRV